MIIFSIDLGSHSIKILESKIEKKKIIHLQHHLLKLDTKISNKELLEQSEENKPEKKNEETVNFFDEQLFEEQIKQLRVFLASAPEESVILFQVPTELMSSRFKFIPLRNVKKAKQIIPFQLEEDIPYFVTEIHLNTYLYPYQKGNNAICLFTKTEVFSHYHQSLKKHELIPSYLTHELRGFTMWFESEVAYKGVSHNDDQGVSCILDIGHRSTKAYVYNNDKLIASNICFIAGQHINEMIVAHYGVSIDEAVEFKHKSGFVLTSDQLESVNEQQKEFAMKIDEVLSKLIIEFKRWELSLKVTESLAIDKVFITGGTSLLKNIANYFSEKTSIPTQLLPPTSQAYKNLSFRPQEHQLYSCAHALSLTQQPHYRPTNLLSGEFREEGEFFIPLHTIGYSFTRVLFLLIFITLGTTAHNLILSLEDEAITKKTKAVLENPNLNLPPRDKSLLKAKPQLLLKNLEKKKKEILASYNVLSNLKSVDVMRGLNLLSGKIDSTDCVLSKYYSDEYNSIRAIFTQCSGSTLKKLRTTIESANLKNILIEQETKELHIEFDS